MLAFESQSIHMSWSTLHRLSTDCQSSIDWDVHRLSTNCLPSINRDINQMSIKMSIKCWWRVDQRNQATLDHQCFSTHDPIWLIKYTVHIKWHPHIVGLLLSECW